jgi:hypothetical protein
VSFQAQVVPDYPRVFEGNYAKALAFIAQNAWMRDSLLARGIDADIALAVVFPELIRFSEFRNSAETRGLEMVYSQYGQAYADFSIGNFQMKPSFIESLEKDWDSLSHKPGFDRMQFSAFTHEDTYECRIARVRRMNDVQWQLNYLSIFMLYIENKYGKMFSDRTEKCRFYSMAYNVGYKFNRKLVLLKGNKKFFYTGFSRPVQCYRYADISVYYFLSLKDLH